MALYTITARRINDRPDADGWHSYGQDLPVFMVDAVSAFNAASIAHDIAGAGCTHLTRTVVSAYRVADDGTDDYATTTWWWQGGSRVQPTRVMRRYAKGGDVITGQMCAEGNADALTWFTEDGGVFLRVTRASGGKWAIESSDHAHRFTSGDYQRRFTDPADALYLVERKVSTRVVEVTDW